MRAFCPAVLYGATQKQPDLKRGVHVTQDLRHDFFRLPDLSSPSFSSHFASVRPSGPSSRGRQSTELSQSEPSRPTGPGTQVIFQEIRFYLHWLKLWCSEGRLLGQPHHCQKQVHEAQQVSPAAQAINSVLRIEFCCAFRQASSSFSQHTAIFVPSLACPENLGLKALGGGSGPHRMKPFRHQDDKMSSMFSSTMSTANHLLTI